MQSIETRQEGTFKKLQDMVARTLRVSPDSVTASMTNEDIAAWDSIGHVNLMIALEQAFDVVLEVEDFPELTSVPAILHFLQVRGC